MVLWKAPGDYEFDKIKKLIDLTKKQKITTI
jgi:hypothetical protein